MSNRKKAPAIGPFNTAQFRLIRLINNSISQAVRQLPTKEDWLPANWVIPNPAQTVSTRVVLSLIARGTLFSTNDGNYVLVDDVRDIK